MTMRYVIESKKQTEFTQHFSADENKWQNVTFYLSSFSWQRKRLVAEALETAEYKPIRIYPHVKKITLSVESNPFLI